MALNAENVRVAVTGAVYVADTGTTLPTSVSSSLGAFDDLGYLDDDGFTEGQDVDQDDITAWQNGTVLRRTITSQSKTFEFTMVETKGPVLEFVNPGSTIVGDTLAIGPVTAVRRVLVFDVIDDDITLRIVVPNCEITDFDDIEYKNGEAIKYHVTVTAYPDDSNVVVYKISDDPAWAIVS